MDLIVSRQGDLWQARLGTLCHRCAVGPSGTTRDKREGDGATPVGCWPLRRLLYRADRLAAPVTRLPLQPLRESDGWCDDPADDNYNRPVTRPYPASHEALWRDDRVYDLIVVLGHNDDPPKPGAGSAIFLHVARADYAPTQGCVALRQDHLLAVLRAVDPDSRL